MTRRILVGFLVIGALMSSHVLEARGVDATHFRAMRLTRLEPAMALPDMRVPSIEGQEVALRSFRGRVVLLNFWTTW